MILECKRIQKDEFSKGVIELYFCKRCLYYSDSYQIKVLFIKKKKFSNKFKKNKHFIECDKEYNSHYNAYYFDFKCKNGEKKALKKAQKFYDKILEEYC